MYVAIVLVCCFCCCCCLLLFVVVCCKLRDVIVACFCYVERLCCVFDVLLFCVFVFGELFCRCLLFVILLFCAFSVGLYANGVVYVFGVALACCCFGLLCVVVVVFVCFVCVFVYTCVLDSPKQLLVLLVVFVCVALFVCCCC